MCVDRSSLKDRGPSNALLSSSNGTGRVPSQVFPGTNGPSPTGEVGKRGPLLHFSIFGRMNVLGPEQKNRAQGHIVRNQRWFSSQQQEVSKKKCGQSGSTSSASLIFDI